MGEPAKRGANYDDLLALPDRLVGEILNGELVTHPRPSAPHARAATRLTLALGPFDDGGGAPGGPGGWVILHEPELRLHGNVLVPDLAGWRRERMPYLPDAAAFELAPDWVCEVLSPSTEAGDRANKMPIYAHEQVHHVWLVNPTTKLLEVYRLEGGQWVLLGSWREDAKVRAQPFDAFDLELGRLWQR